MQLNAWFIAIPSRIFCQIVENKRKIKLQAQYLVITVYFCTSRKLNKHSKSPIDGEKS